MRLQPTGKVAVSSLKCWICADCESARVTGALGFGETPILPLNSVIIIESSFPHSY